MTVREVIHFLVFIHVIVYVVLERLRRPQQIPIMRLRALPSICFENSPDQLGLTLYQFEVHVSVAVLGILVIEDSTLLEVQSTLAIPNQLYQTSIRRSKNTNKGQCLLTIDESFSALKLTNSYFKLF